MEPLNGSTATRRCLGALTAAYSHAALGENAVSSISKLEFSRLIFDWLDKFLRYKLIKHGSFVRLQIRVRSIQ